MTILKTTIDLPAGTQFATVYVGTPEALQAEIGLLPCYRGKYVVAAIAADGTEYTPEVVDTKAGAKEMARDYAEYLSSLGQLVTISWIA